MIDTEDVTECENYLDFSKFLNDESVEEFSNDFWNAESFEAFKKNKNASMRNVAEKFNHLPYTHWYYFRLHLEEYVKEKGNKKWTNIFPFRPFKLPEYRGDVDNLRKVFKDCDNPEQSCCDYCLVENRYKQH